MTDNSLHSAFAQQPRTNLIADLVMGRLIPAPIWQKQRNYRLKFYLLRTALFYTPALAQCWIIFPCVLTLISYLPRRSGKVHRQYLTRGLNASQRAQAIISHYQFIDSLSGAQLAAAMTAAKETPLLELQGKDETRFTLGLLRR